MLPQGLKAAGVAILHHLNCAMLEPGSALSPQAVSIIALGVIAGRLYREHYGDPLGAE